MKPKPLNFYIEEYERKTGDKFVFRSDYWLYYLPTMGVMTCKVDGPMLIIEFVSGNINFWRDFAELKCRELGLSVIGTFCIRNIYSYMRLMGGEILDELNINNKKRLLCQDNIGRLVIATHHIDLGEDREPQYMITQYLDKKAVSSFKELKESEL